MSLEEILLSVSQAIRRKNKSVAKSGIVYFILGERYGHLGELNVYHLDKGKGDFSVLQSISIIER